MAESKNSNPDVLPLEEQGIISACERLHAAEKLLVNPHPQAIQQAGFVLQQAVAFTGNCADSPVSAEDLAKLRDGCTRVRALLEGALRAQWAYIHRISSATSTYTAGPSTKRWSPRVCTLDLKA